MVPGLFTGGGGGSGDITRVTSQQVQVYRNPKIQLLGPTQTLSVDAPDTNNCYRYNSQVHGRPQLLQMVIFPVATWNAKIANVVDDTTPN